MGKKIFTLLTVLVIAVVTLGASTVAYGRGTHGILVDERGFFAGDEVSELNQLLSDTARTLDMNVAVLIADDITTSEQQTCDDFLDMYFDADDDSIVLMIAREGSGFADWVSYTNHARTVFKPQLDHIFDAVYYGLDSGDSLNYYAAVEQFCSYLVKNRNGYVGDVTGDISYKTRLEDYQNALTSAEETELLGVMQSTADNIGANVGVVLTDGIGYGNEPEYTDDFLNDSFGYDSSSIVLMLVRAGTGEQDWIACSNHANDIYGNRTDRIFDAVYDGLDSGSGDNYPAAIREFCNYLENHRLAYEGDSSEDYDNGIFAFINMGSLAGIVVAVLITVAVVNGMAAGYRKKSPVSARAYIENDMIRFTAKKDIFVREFTTSHRISSSSSGSHGGGRSGGGGHSRSGGHGGGGGRHR